MNEKVTKLALASRLIILCLQFIFNTLIPDHNPEVFKSPKPANLTDCVADKAVQFFFGGLRRWDAEYFLHIAEYGYSYENTLAFYPLYPTVVRLIAKGVVWFTFYPTFRSVALVVAVLVNIYFFHRAANCLYELTQEVFKDSNKAWNATVMFCFNPASIFFSAPYSEGLFCWLTFSLMLSSATHLSFIKTTAALALSILCRSNGLVNMGYPIYFLCRKAILNRSFSQILKLLAILLLSTIPLTFYNFYAFKIYCTFTGMAHDPEVAKYAKDNNYILAGERDPNNSPWCDHSFPFPYSYIQSHYWNVGFLRYYKLKQLPNFFLAAPIVIFIFTKSLRYLLVCSDYLKSHGLIPILRVWKALPFVLHALFLTIFCTFYVHVQISTRMIASSTPCLYWFAAEILPRTFDRIRFKSLNSVVLYWFGGYFILGTALFSNFLPWT